MSVSIVRLGTPRRRGEGIRLGTVRHPPRGVPKDRYASDDWFDVWLPNLAPSAGLVAMAREKRRPGWWRLFSGRYEREMAKPEHARLLDMLAALSHQTNFSVGCYCEDERLCHRRILRRLLQKRRAKVKRRS